MNYIKKTAIFCLISGLIIGTTQANSGDDIESWLKSHNWHRMTIFGTKMSTQDILFHAPLSIICIGLGFEYFYLALTRDFSAPRVRKGLNGPYEAIIMGTGILALGVTGLGIICHNTQAIQAENQ